MKTTLALIIISYKPPTPFEQVILTDKDGKLITSQYDGIFSPQYEAERLVNKVITLDARWVRPLIFSATNINNELYLGYGATVPYDTRLIDSKWTHYADIAKLDGEPRKLIQQTVQRLICQNSLES